MRTIALITACLGLLLISCRSGPATKPLGSASPHSRNLTARTPAALSLSPAPPPAEGPRPSSFSGMVSSIDRGRLTHSWREGCPVPIEDLRLVTVNIWGFDDRMQKGEMVVHRDHAGDVVAVMRDLYDARFPIERMELIDNYAGDDDRSMEANNSSAFNCREITGRPGAWSEHAYGRAIDINPVQNPYISSSGKVFPRAGASYAQRSQQAKGMIQRGDAVVRAFKSKGWEWGGEWSSPRDYQHFSATGR